MSRFLTSLTFFITISGILFTLSITSLNSIVLNAKNSYQISPKITTLFLGHSHAECSYNDSIIPNSLNLASSGEAYFYTYLKLKSVLKHNSHIERIVVEFSNNQISEGMDDWTWDANHISRNFPSLSPICSIDDHMELCSNSPSAYLSGLQKNLNLNVKKLTLNSYRYDIKNSGGFRGLAGNFESEKDTLEETIDYTLLSNINIKYLQKIIVLAKANRIEMSLIRSPTWHTNHFLKNEVYFQDIRQKLFASINFIDLRDFFSELKYFRDSGHLNITGATELSEYFKNNLN